MPSAKEPHYFAKDFPNYPSVKSEDEYLKLFKSCTSAHLSIGEASVWYLYSDVALKLIRDFSPRARIIVMLRNPIDLAPSMHRQALYNHNEDEPDFENAWHLQDARQRGEHIPKACRAEQILQYRSVAALGTQLRRTYDIFPRDRVMTIFLQDLSSSPVTVYREALKFLGLPDDGRTEFGVYNDAKTHKSALLGRLTQAPPASFVKFSRLMRNRLGLDIVGPLNFIRRLNDTSATTETLRPDFRKQLVQYFRPEIETLSALTNRDLYSWVPDPVTKRLDNNPQ